MYFECEELDSKNKKFYAEVYLGSVTKNATLTSRTNDFPGIDLTNCSIEICSSYIKLSGFYRTSNSRYDIIFIFKQYKLYP